MMIFTAFRKQNRRVDVFYDPMEYSYTLRTEAGDITADHITTSAYLQHVVALKADSWKQLDFVSTAKLGNTTHG